MKIKLLALFTLCSHLVTNQAWGDSNAAQDHLASQGTQRWSARVVLTPTPAAPAGASGVACLEAGNGPGATSGTLLVKTQQLSPGNYWLRAVRRSDRSEVLLGLFSIFNPTAQPDREAGDDRNERSSAYVTDLLQSQIRVELPPDLPPADIGQILLSQPGGNDLLKGTVKAG